MFSNEGIQRFLLIIIFALYASFANAQVTIGALTEPEYFSVLQLETSGGLRLNQLNSNQKDELTTKLQSINNTSTKGLTIYNTDTKVIQYWDGNQWIQMIGMEDLFSEGDYLTSKGVNALPEWSTIKFPIVKRGEYYLHAIDVKQDIVGAVLGYLEDEQYITYDQGDLLDNEWSVLNELTVELDIPDVPNAPTGIAKNKLSILFQTNVQIGTGDIKNSYLLKQYVNGNLSNPQPLQYEDLTEPSVSFTIGFFIGDDINGYGLQLVRVERVDSVGTHMSVQIYNVEGTLEDLPPGKQTLKVAVRRRSQRNMESITGSDAELRKSIAIGTKIPDATNINSFMARSFLKMKTYVLDYD